MKRINLFPIIMVIFIGIILLLALAFPVKKAFQSKNDRLIESGLYDVKRAIDDYHTSNKNLPRDLSVISTSSDDAKRIINNNLVEYKVVSQSPVPSSDKLTGANPNTVSRIDTSAKYELCVNYRFEKQYSYSSDYINTTNEYETYIDNYEHPAGKVCYKLKTGRY